MTTRSAQIKIPANTKSLSMLCLLIANINAAAPPGGWTTPALDMHPMANDTPIAAASHCGICNTSNNKNLQNRDIRMETINPYTEFLGWAAGAAVRANCKVKRAPKGPRTIIYSSLLTSLTNILRPNSSKRVIKQPIDIHIDVATDAPGGGLRGGSTDFL